MKITVQLNPMIQDNANTTAKEMVANFFAFGRMAPLWFQSSIKGPNVGCVVIQVCSLSDERAKQNAARIMKGTVGSKGKMTPKRPKQTLTSPKMSHSIFMTC